MNEDHLKILAIDDIRDNLWVLKAILSEAFPNAHLIMAQHGEEGLSLCLSERPDIVLLDIVMPLMDGFEVCRKIKSNGLIHHTPVIMLTAAKTDKESRIKALEAGADAFLSKPVDIAELTAQIHAMVRIKEAEERKIHEKVWLEKLVQERTESLKKELNERKQAEKKVRWLTRAIEQSPVSMMLVNPEGIIEYVNPRFKDLTGYSVGEVLGKNPSILNAGVQDASFYEHLWNTILSGNDWKGELQNKKKNGDLYWERSVISPIVDEEGKIAQFINIKEDITEKKKMLSELVEAREKAEESDRLKTAFLNIMSHEIRTPLSAILGFGSLLLDPDISREDRVSYYGFLTRSSNQLLSIMDNIAQIATLEAGQEKLRESDTDLRQIFSDLYQQFKEKEKPGVLSLTYRIALSERESRIVADKTKLMQILTNLIYNAIKFTEKGSIVFQCQRSGEDLHFIVEDTGPGIPKEYQEVIFERFRQVRGEYSRDRGNGLGLSIAKAYVELMGGKIWVESENGKGSAFHFTIPHRPVSHGTLPEENIQNTEENRSVGVILMAEDEWANYFIVEKILKRHHYQVIHVDNGEKAVEICRTNKNIQLVLMDLKMPVMDGYEATRIIAQENPSLPVIALSAYVLNENKRKAIESGCVDFIEKPVVKEHLLQKIQEHLHPENGDHSKSS